MPIRTLCVALAMLSLALVGFASDPSAPPEDAAAPYAPGLPAGAAKYDSARYTQSISVLNNRDDIQPFAIAKLDDKRWHQPGGLEGVAGWKSEKYRTLPLGEKVKVWIGNVQVENSISTGRLKPDGTAEKFKQHNRALLRSYPDGTRFDELLVNAKTGVTFEHRVRIKQSGKWVSEVYHKDEAARPKGYTGLTVSCSSCHAECGQGKYNSGLVPGGDGVFSDPLPWKLWTNAPIEGDR